MFCRFFAVPLLLVWTAFTSVPSANGQPLVDPVGVAAMRGEAVAEALRNQPARDYEFNRASLRDVLRFLAGDAGISYVSVREATEAEDNLVTFDLRASPFRALEIIAKANGVALVYEEGIWYLRPYNESELVARIYKLKYNTSEVVTSDSAASTAPSAAQGGTGGTGVGGSVPDLGLSLSGVSNIFESDPQQLLDDIKSLIGIPTTGFEAVRTGEVTVDTPAGLGVSPDRIQPRSGETGSSVAAGEPGGPQVIWNSDSNTLYVVATRQQQQWVEGYLQSMDRPQALIAIEVKFIETNRDPREQLGVDWSGTLQNGFTVAARDIQATPNGELVLNEESGRIRSLGASAPYSAVLSASDVAVTLRAFLNDRDSTQTAYPRVLTRNNREVVIRSVLNQPVLASTASVTPGIGGTTTASVSYLPIGTIINVLPKEMADGSVAMNVSISISNIVNEVRIGQTQDLYPVASTRVFSAALSVASGFTLAIGGLEEATDNEINNGVPFLKDIPLLGEAFKSKDRRQSKKNLLLFITPTLLPSDGKNGMAIAPVSTVPLPPGSPPPPAFSVDGALVGGVPALDSAICWLEYQCRYFGNVVFEARFQPHDLGHVRSLEKMCEMLIVQIELMKTGSPDRDAVLNLQLDRVASLLEQFEQISKSGRDAMIGI